MAKYDKETVDKICELVASGEHLVKDICAHVGISQAIFYRWQEEKVEFVEALKEAKKKRLQNLGTLARSGLAKLVDTYKYEESSTEFISDEKGKPIIKSKKVVEKTMMPNATAVIFALKNLESEDFADSQELKVSGSITATGFEKLTLAQLEAKRKELESMLENDDDLPDTGNIQVTAISEPTPVKRKWNNLNDI